MYNFLLMGFTAISVIVILTAVVPRAAAIFWSMFLISTLEGCPFFVSFVFTANTVALLESPINKIPPGPKVKALIDFTSAALLLLFGAFTAAINNNPATTVAR